MSGRRAEQRIGTVLRGKYRIDRVLGIGGMASVYACTHRNQKQFAIKMLHPELSILGDIRARFLREGYAANSVKHPGAVAVLDDDVAEDGAAFLVMELLEGEGVDALLARWNGRLPLREVLVLGYQLLDVLDSAHKRSIVHRDIKPANLFVCADGQLKVLDFGIARVRDVTATHPTGTGAMLGTPAYMPPEQALGRASEIDAQTDIWAVGATLFTLLSGRLVHDGENAAQLLVKAATARARSLSTVAPDTPGPVVDLVSRALAFEKASRWPSASAMGDAVSRVHGELFGRLPGEDQLVALFAAGQAVATRASEPMMAMSPVPPAERRQHLLAQPVAATTAKPVSAGGSALPPPPRPRAAPLLVTGVAIAAVVSALGLHVGRTRTQGASSATGARGLAEDSAPPAVQAASSTAMIDGAVSETEPAPPGSAKVPSPSPLGGRHAPPASPGAGRPHPALGAATTSPATPSSADHNPLHMNLQ